MAFFPDAARWLGGLLYPPFCTVCGAGLPWSSAGAEIGCSGSHLCDGCAGQVRRLGEGVCFQCSGSFSGQVLPGARCADCLGRPPAFECAVAPVLLRGVAREVVHQFKYLKKTHLRFTLARWMVQALEDPRLREPVPDVWVPVPLHWSRRLWRGFNQAELLAEALRDGCASRPGGPILRVEELLGRVRGTGTQTVLRREERSENLRGAFSVRRWKRVEGLHVVLVDDVLTTGSTLDACARTLLLAGAASVRALAAARG